MPGANRTFPIVKMPTVGSVSTSVVVSGPLPTLACACAAAGHSTAIPRRTLHTVLRTDLTNVIRTLPEYARETPVLPARGRTAHRRRDPLPRRSVLAHRRERADRRGRE